MHKSEIHIAQQLNRIAHGVADVEAVQTRQHDVEQHEIEVAIEGMVQAGASIFRAGDHVAVVDQHVLEPGPYGGLVLDHQNVRFCVHDSMQASSWQIGAV